MYSSRSEVTPALLSSRIVRRSPVFYGWIIVVVSTLGMIMTSPGQTYAVSIFIEHFIVDLGISRGLVSTLYTVGTLVGSFVLPFIGRQIDARGPRLAVLFVSIGFGAACIYMGFIANAWMLALGFIAIRMLGQGALGLVSQYTINQWWVRRRGSVMGISGLIMSLLGLGIFPSAIYMLIGAYGWRNTYPILGMVVLLIMAPVGYFFYRERPERYGLTPDGDFTDANGSGKAPAPLVEEEWTLAEAIRTRAFWIVVLGLGAIGMLSTGLFFHAVSIFQDNGLPASVAATAFVPVAITTALVNVIGGLLVDRLSVRYLLVAALVGQAVILVMAHSLNSVALAMAYGVLLGTVSGLQRIVSTVVWAAYFGRRYLGTITGTTTTIMIAGSALGPMPLGIARDLLGSYNLALNIAALLPLLLAVLSLFLRKPRKENIGPN
jgi:MFS transporter, OFA family, oxalate/formate antiporter